MNEYQKKYIELKKQYEEADKTADSVQALYRFKDFLEGQAAPEAKRVPVDVCEILGLRACPGLEADCRGDYAPSRRPEACTGRSCFAV